MAQAEDSGPGAESYLNPPTSWNSSLAKSSKHGSTDFRPTACQLTQTEFCSNLKQSQVQDTTPLSGDSP